MGCMKKAKRTESCLKELWRPVLGFEDFYEISNLGRLKRLTRKSKNSRNANTFKTYKERISKKTHKNKDKYISLSLTVEGTTTYKSAHVVVLEAFIKKPFVGAVVNHENGDKHDNRLENLSWMTSSENSKHAVLTGLQKAARGEMAGNAKLSVANVLEIRKMRYELGYSCRKISKKFNISVKQVSVVSRGVQWRDLTPGDSK